MHDPVLYGFSLAYLVAPNTFDSVNVIAFVSELPEYVKYAGKAILAAPFAFHSLNGLRHLAWDSGKRKTSSTFFCVPSPRIVKSLFCSLISQVGIQGGLRSTWRNRYFYGCAYLDVKL